MKKKIIGVTCAALMTACASTEQAADTQQSQQGAGGLPQWVMNPYIDDGFASAQCVPYSSNMSIDRQLAVANARTDLAQQLETKDKPYEVAGFSFWECVSTRLSLCIHRFGLQDGWVSLGQ